MTNQNTGGIINPIKKLIENGEISTHLSKQKFDRHIEGTKEFEKYTTKNREIGKSPPSKLYITFDKAQEIIKKYAGTGKLADKNKFSEYILLDEIIGAYEERGVYINTYKLEIVYGKKGAHLYAVKELIEND